MKVRKSLTFCYHGFSVLYELDEVSALPQTLCGHVKAWSAPYTTIKQVIKKVETIKQPDWVKYFKLWKFQVSVVKYR